MSDFANRLIAWQKQHGRHDLPWQNTRDPYAIYVSEIMLQQSQVSTVIGYYQKFMQRFPSLASLAQASQDEVLQYWSGLGYYSRARNLHKTAQRIATDHGGVFPNDFTVIQSLPGIGRSTAAAIVSFAFDQVQTILDGNVKRVLARHFMLSGWTGSKKVEQQLWQLAESLLPKQGMVAYTQGIMDLGATVCTRSQPKCGACPMQASCVALQANCVHTLPTPKPRKVLPQKSTTMLVLRHGEQIMLEKRPSSGIWGGLWSFPETDAIDGLETLVQSRFGLSASSQKPLATISHAFSHYKLSIHVQPMLITKRYAQLNEPQYSWLSLEEANAAGIPTPVRKILQQLLAEAQTKKSA
jgi:A/G-specific adenine glycosylase